MIQVIGIFILSASVFLSGCKAEQNKKQEENIATQTVPKLETKQQREEVSQEKSTLQKIGISTEGDKIVIEPKKTKAFLEEIAKSLQQEAIEIEQKAKKIKKEDFGIEKNKDKITIDINKTQKILNSFTKELEGVAKSLEKVINEKVKKDNW